MPCLYQCFTNKFVLKYIITIFSFIFFTEFSKNVKPDYNNVSHLIYNNIETMANFEPVYEITKEWEGGYQNNLADKANKNSLGEYVGTKYGVSAVAYESYLKRPPTVEDMKAIDRPTSKKILKTKYWDVIRADEIRNQDIAEIIFGTYIGNPTNTNKAVEAALKELGHDVEIEWNYSDDVIKALNRSNKEKLFNLIKENQVKYVLGPMKASGSQFYAGWKRKVDSFEFDKKKWLIIGVAAIVLIAGSYYAYKKGYYKKAINYFKK
jgi:lysozyme family protein